MNRTFKQISPRYHQRESGTPPGSPQEHAEHALQLFIGSAAQTMVVEDAIPSIPSVRHLVEFRVLFVTGSDEIFSYACGSRVTGNIARDAEGVTSLSGARTIADAVPFQLDVRRSDYAGEIVSQIHNRAAKAKDSYLSAVQQLCSQVDPTNSLFRSTRLVF